ncbi:hypothetical protein B4N89_41830 [Embleya scabrispora]|uniref:Uncharacterized protein n=1 Tax=Embleya scabrispora TaxID=159449 RepID=A0A1T3NK39_9ACTN|nr:hypothetical protein B4N89_41830 [Embleya scabrispora]
MSPAAPSPIERRRDRRPCSGRSGANGPRGRARCALRGDHARASPRLGSEDAVRRHRRPRWVAPPPTSGTTTGLDRGRRRAATVRPPGERSEGPSPARRPHAAPPPAEAGAPRPGRSSRTAPRPRSTRPTPRRSRRPGALRVPHARG